MSDTASLIALADLPLIKPGDDLAALLAAALERRIGKLITAGDVLVVAQKIVSKAEGRYVDLARVEPGAEAQRLARETDKDPRLVQVILDESNRVVRHRPGVLIVEHRLGYVMANAGIDRSNVDPAMGKSRCCCCRAIPMRPPLRCARSSARISASRRRSS